MEIRSAGAVVETISRSSIVWSWSHQSRMTSPEQPALPAPNTGGLTAGPATIFFASDQPDDIGNRDCRTDKWELTEETVREWTWLAADGPAMRTSRLFAGSGVRETEDGSSATASVDHASQTEQNSTMLEDCACGSASSASDCSKYVVMDAPCRLCHVAFTGNPCSRVLEHRKFFHVQSFAILWCIILSSNINIGSYGGRWLWR